MKDLNLNLKSISESIVNDIIYDLSGRCGLGNEWEQIDDDVTNEIKNKWKDIVEKYLVELKSNN